MTGYKSKKAMSKAGDMMSDKGYEVSTHEEQAEFEAKRNYTHEVDMQMIILQAIKDLTIKVETLKDRVAKMEYKYSKQKDDGK